MKVTAVQGGKSLWGLPGTLFPSGLAAADRGAVPKVGSVWSIITSDGLTTGKVVDAGSNGSCKWVLRVQDSVGNKIHSFMLDNFLLRATPSKPAMDEVRTARSKEITHFPLRNSPTCFACCSRTRSHIQRKLAYQNSRLRPPTRPV